MITGDICGSLKAAQAEPGEQKGHKECRERLRDVI